MVRSAGFSNRTNPSWSNEESSTSPFNPFSDSYMLSDSDPFNSTKTSGDDISMPDYQSSSSSSRAISSMTGVSYEHSKQPSVADASKDDQYEQILRLFDSPKEPVSRVQTPAEALSTLPIGFKRPESRPVDTATRRSISSILKDMSLSGPSRDLAGFQARSARRVPFGTLVGDGGADEIYAMPAMYFGARRTPLSGSRGNEDSLKSPRQRNDQSHHKTPVKVPVQVSADVAIKSNPTDASLGAVGSVAIPQPGKFDDDLRKECLHIENLVEPKFQAREVSAESSEL